jgi:hypothetical protein
MTENFVVITDGTVKVYKQSDDTLVATASNLGNGNYPAENIEEGEYYFVAEAPGKGTVIRNFSLPDPMNLTELFKNITISMVQGISIIPVNVKNQNDVAIITGIKVKISRILGIHDTGGKYDVANVPKGSQLLELIPDEGEIDNYQNYKKLYNITDGLIINEILYPPIALQIRIINSSGVEIPGAKLYHNPFKLGTPSPDSEIYKTNGQFILPRQSDGVILLTATAPNHIAINREIGLSYSHTVTLGTPGNMLVNIVLDSIGGDNNTIG